MDVDIRGESGPSGRGKMIVLEGAVQIIKMDGEDMGRTFVIPFDKVFWPLPENLAPNTVYEPAYFRLSSEGDALYQVSPMGTETRTKFIVRYSGIERDQETGEPRMYDSGGRAIRFKNGHQGWIPEHQIIPMQLEILNTEWKGGYLRHRAVWVFQPRGDGTTKIVGRGRWWSGWARQMESLLRCAGFDFQNENIPWSDDPYVILEALDQKLLETRPPFEVVVNEKGYTKDFEKLADGVVIPGVTDVANAG